jgi:arginase family enzyme
MSLSEFVISRLGDRIVSPRPCFLSVDIDAFDSSYAPGASQSWPTGLTPREFFPFMDLLLHRLDVRSLGIYEVSPPLDVASATSKLGALIVHRFVSHFSEHSSEKKSTHV